MRASDWQDKDKLQGSSNWFTWSQLMRIELMSHGLWEQVKGVEVNVAQPGTSSASGTSVKPEPQTSKCDPVARIADSQKDIEAYLRISARCTRHVCRDIKGVETGYEAWKILTDNYSKLSRRELKMREEELRKMYKRRGGSLDDFARRIDDLGAELLESDSKVPTDSEAMAFRLLDGIDSHSFSRFTVSSSFKKMQAPDWQDKDKLQGPSNWTTWSQLMRIELMSHGLWERVKGVEMNVAQPETSCESGTSVKPEPQTSKCDPVARISDSQKDIEAYLRISARCTRGVCRDIGGVETGYEAWKILTDNYSKLSRRELKMKEEEFKKIFMRPGESLDDFARRIEVLGAELRESDSKVSADSEAMALALLDGIDPHRFSGYGMAKYHLDEYVPGKSRSALRDVVGILKRGSTADSEGDASAFPAQSSNMSRREHQKVKGRKPCKHCGKVCHPADRCWYKPRDPGGSRGSNHAKLARESVNNETSDVYALATADSQLEATFLLDTGANHHYVSDGRLFETYQTTPHASVKGITSQPLAIAGQGRVVVWIEQKGSCFELVLPMAYHVPTTKTNLASWSSLVDDGIVPCSRGREDALRSHFCRGHGQALTISILIVRDSHGRAILDDLMHHQLTLLCPQMTGPTELTPLRADFHFCSDGQCERQNHCYPINMYTRKCMMTGYRHAWATPEPPHPG
ncbi:hypothetical protein E5Q_03664 [Mixia osmundae IAM 14324]|uniref:Retrovirus-related Pol polyprotein from transposon TNT 1-94-like beta-barrel domain-containing protein n=1 Tax=Mixia osmundae (strain CBS 9802 / IAM 14324 / JCM 22182 / KY 12970) TaxID=764103 RepID=G7E2D0_MIXOS|nr:hypothetical protein E5Q_03664 [Mixia osmundae IAM 14324]